MYESAYGVSPRKPKEDGVTPSSGIPDPFGNESLQFIQETELEKVVVTGYVEDNGATNITHNVYGFKDNLPYLINSYNNLELIPTRIKYHCEVNSFGMKFDGIGVQMTYLGGPPNSTCIINRK